MQKVLYAPRAANKKKYEPALFQMSRLDSAPALGILSSNLCVRGIDQIVLIGRQTLTLEIQWVPAS